MNNEISETKGFFKGFFWGGLLGVLFVFLCGTDRGKRLRKDFSTVGEDLFEDLEKLVEEFEEKTDVESKSKNEVSISQISSTAGPISEELGKIQEQEKEISEEITTLKKRFFRNIPKRG